MQRLQAVGWPNLLLATRPRLFRRLRLFLCHKCRVPWSSLPRPPCNQPYPFFSPPILSLRILFANQPLRGPPSLYAPNLEKKNCFRFAACSYFGCLACNNSISAQGQGRGQAVQKGRGWRHECPFKAGDRAGNLGKGRECGAGWAWHLGRLGRDGDQAVVATPAQLNHASPLPRAVVGVLGHVDAGDGHRGHGGGHVPPLRLQLGPAAVGVPNS